MMSVVALAAMWGCAAGDEGKNADDLAQGKLELKSAGPSVAAKKQPGKQQQPRHPRGWRGKGHHRGHAPGEPGGESSGQGGAAAAAGGATSTGTYGVGGAMSMGGSMSMGGAITTGAAGTYLTANCGDGNRELYEGCDDGNTADGDGCSAYCWEETGWNCSTGVCLPAVCGNGQMESLADGSYEDCDDGNTANGDGCNTDCHIEVGWDCWSGTCVQAVCGNRQYECAMDANGEYQCEQCDDGNQIAGDGCNASCGLEPNWTCDDISCHRVVCGDGLVDCTVDAAGNGTCEGCDDSNNVSGDGCSATCEYEGGGVGGAPNYGFGGGTSSGGVPVYGFGGAMPTAGWGSTLPMAGVAGSN